MRVAVLLVTMDMITGLVGVYESIDVAKAYVHARNPEAIWETEYGHQRAKLGGKDDLEYEIVETDVQPGGTKV